MIRHAFNVLACLLLFLACFLFGCGHLKVVCAAEPDINVDFPGKVTSLTYIKATFAGQAVKMPLVNGLIPDQMVESSEAGTVTQRTFSYKSGVVYDRRAYYSYSGPVKGPNITESVQVGDGPEMVKKTFTTQIYTLRKMP